MNDLEVKLIISKMIIKLEQKLHEIGVVDSPIDPDLLTDIVESSGNIPLEYIYTDRVYLQNQLIGLVANNLAKKIENAGMQLPVFGAVRCYPYFTDGRVTLLATYIYGSMEKKVNDRRSKNLSN